MPGGNPGNLAEATATATARRKHAACVRRVTWGLCGQAYTLIYIPRCVWVRPSAESI